MKKKLCSILLCLSMTLGLLPQVALANTHADHCICGATHQDIGDHKNDESSNITWTAWGDNSGETTSLPSTAGNYYLTDDVELSDTWEPADGTVLCLNGHNITTEKDAQNLTYAIKNKSGKTLTLTDCQATAGKVTNANGSGIYNEGNFIMYGGEISENAATGIKSISPVNRLTLYGGKISKNNAGGVVHIDGYFIMYGGEISDNTAQENGGGIYNKGIFHMYDGKISDNAATEDGGGIYNEYNFYMDGGEISNNTATKDGGGIYNGVLFQMSGGKISGNTSNGNGGGVFNQNELQISSDITITGNKGSSPLTDNNLYLVRGSKVILNTPGLGNNAKIGISLADDYGDGYILNDTFSFKTENFTSDDSTKYIASVDGNLYVKKMPTFSVKQGDTPLEDRYNIYTTDSTPQTFTIENTSASGTMNMKVTLSGKDASAFTLGGVENDTAFDIDASGSKNFTLAPKSGLTAGTTYTATVTVALTDNNKEISFTIYYTEDTPTPTPSTGSSSSSSSKPQYQASVKSGENGSAKASPAHAKAGKTVTVTLRPDAGYLAEDVLVLDKNGNEIEVTRKDDTTFTFVMPDGKVSITPQFIAEEPAEETPAEEPEMPATPDEIAPDAPQPEIAFADVPADAYYAQAVAWAVANGITSGTAANEFSPAAACPRAQILTFLWRMAGKPTPAPTGSFADVAADAYYAQAVAWAIENGIASGMGDNLFAPDGICTRADILCFLYRMAGAPEVESDATFKDVPADAYYAQAVAWAIENGIASGFADGSFAPQQQCTRADAVAMLYRMG